MTKRLAIAALVAASALIAGCLQGCLSEVAQAAVTHSIDFYCHSGRDKYIESLKVEMSRRTRAICKKFQASMQAGIEHSAETEHHEHSMGANASLQVYCYSKSAEEWKQVLIEIGKREDECVSNLTTQIDDIHSNNTQEWTMKYNLIVNFSFQFFLSAQYDITAGFEYSLNSTLQAVDRTSEGVRNITSHITSSVQVYVEYVCEWINYDYQEKIEISFNKKIEEACSLGNSLAGEAAAGVSSSVEHSSGTAEHSMGINANISIHYEQECRDYNTEEAEKILKNTTLTIMAQCTTYVIKHIEEKGESAASISDCAKSFLEEQRENTKTLESHFQSEIKTVFEISGHAEASASSASSKAALPPVLSRSLAGGSASTKPVLLIAGIATTVSVVLAAGAIIRRRSDASIGGRSLLQNEAECGEE